MRRRDHNGHITACKISDANPNEMIASWSGDYIYSFDLIRSPDAAEVKSEDTETQPSGAGKGKAKESSERKRKRKKTGSATSTEGVRRSSKPRRAREHGADTGNLALRVRYENGQSEDIAVNEPAVVPTEIMEDTRGALLSESQKRSMQIAKSMVKIRKFIFSLDGSTRASHGPSMKLTAHTPSFTSALGLAACCLPEMDDIIRSWGYPMNPDEEDVVLQQTLRTNRDSSRRFVQAAGTLARFLGGILQTSSSGSSPALQMFDEIGPAPQEGPHTSSREALSYDFLKAIVLWLRGGRQALLQGFKRPPNQRNDNPRFPIPDEAQLSGIDDYLIPYLLRLARETPVPNVDASRFEVDERRRIFQSESAAIIAFSNAIRMPLEDLSRAIMPVAAPDAAEVARPFPASQDRSAALMFWGFKVGRGLLLNAGEDINFQFVDTAFGGLGGGGPEEGRVQEDIDPNEVEDIVDTVTLVRRTSAEQNGESAQEPNSTQDGADVTYRWAGENGDVEMHDAPSRPSRPPAIEIEDTDSGSEVVLMEDLQNDIGEHLAAFDEDQANEGEGNEDDEDEEDNDSAEDGEITAEERHFMFQSASDRGKRRESVQADVPYSTHSRQYRGHCNVRTVKDCNFFGLQDEYVVSGSDSGHLFIWVSHHVLSTWMVAYKILFTGQKNLGASQYLGRRRRSCECSAGPSVRHPRFLLSLSIIFLDASDVALVAVFERIRLMAMLAITES